MHTLDSIRWNWAAVNNNKSQIKITIKEMLCPNEKKNWKSYDVYYDLAEKNNERIERANTRTNSGVYDSLTPREETQSSEEKNSTTKQHTTRTERKEIVSRDYCIHNWLLWQKSWTDFLVLYNNDDHDDDNDNDYFVHQCEWVCECLVGPSIAVYIYRRLASDTRYGRYTRTLCVEQCDV